MDSPRRRCYLSTVHMATQRFILMSDERTLEHPAWGGHPETRERVTAVCERLRTGQVKQVSFVFGCEGPVIE